ncbi:MAG: sugar transferase [Gammaproteobacteria bacterium]
MTKRTVILGTSKLAQNVATELSTQRQSHSGLIGVVSEQQNVALEGFSCPHLGSLSSFREIIVEHAPKRIIVALEDKYEHLPVDQLVEARARQHIVVETGIDVFEKLTGRVAIESMRGSSVLFSRDFRPKPFALATSRLLSIIIATTGLILAFPLMLGVALAVRIDSRGPILFVQDRIGLGGQRFSLFKFRSMFHTGEERSEWTGDNMDKITRVGKLIRKFRLDEFPQFINVIRGDMNIVGPRPHPLSNRELFVLVARNTPLCGEQIPYYSLRQSVRPGITGWAQVRYKYANGLDEEIEKLRYDLYYVKHYSPFLDIRILFETIKIVLYGHIDKESPKPVHKYPHPSGTHGQVEGKKRSDAITPPRLVSTYGHDAADEYHSPDDRQQHVRGDSTRSIR